jgi:chorismate dehydratase
MKSILQEQKEEAKEIAKEKKAQEKLRQQQDDYIDEIKSTTAGLIIGDRALSYRGKSNYIYDLGLGWKEMTGLPFVFAVWVSSKNLDTKFIKSFSDSTALGLLNLDEIKQDNSFSSYDLDVYYSKNISYMLSEEKRKGLEQFLKNIFVNL